MRPFIQVEEALSLIGRGMADGQVSRVTGIPRSTIRYWRSTTRRTKSTNDCPVCGQASLNQSVYAYVLGLYLGDGCISQQRNKAVFRLRITLDARYAGIIEECARAIAALRNGRWPARVRKKGCWEIASYWKHWPCVFPQHGPGKKNQREIRLAPWQAEIGRAYPGQLLRGLIHSDGSRALNRVNVGGRDYVYPRYQFKNTSPGILAIFRQACDDFGVSWTRAGWKTISVSRRLDVAALDRAVGAKA